MVAAWGLAKCLPNPAAAPREEDQGFPLYPHLTLVENCVVYTLHWISSPDLPQFLPLSIKLQPKL